MSRPPAQDDTRPDARLDAYLDGLLEGDAKLAFERVLAERADLRQAVERQRAIDAALGRAMRVPETRELRAIAGPARRGRGHPTTSIGRFLARPLPMGRTLGVAAAIALLVTGAFIVWNTTRPARPGSNRYAPQPWRSMEAIYRDEIASGFRPRIVCTDDAQFSAWFKDRFRQGLVLEPMPDGQRALGLAYANTITPRTIYVLAEADGARIILFVDRADRDQGTTPAPGEGLVLHHGTVGTLTVYELSPLAEPKIIPYLRAPAPR